MCACKNVAYVCVILNVMHYLYVSNRSFDIHISLHGGADLQRINTSVDFRCVNTSVDFRCVNTISEKSSFF